MHIRIILTTVPVVLLLWLGIGADLLQKHQAGLDGAAQESRNLTQAFEENIRRTTEAIDTTIRAARVARAHDPDQFDLAAWERDSGLTRELTLQLSLVDRAGDVVVTNLQKMTGKRSSIADREHFRVPRDTEADDLFISDPVLGRISGRWSVQFVRKLYDTRGAFDGVIVASLDPEFLSRFYSSLDVGQGALLLLGRNGIVRSVAPESVATLGTNLSETYLMTGASVASHGTVRMIATTDGIERTFSWRRIDPYGLIVLVGLSSVDALADYRRDMTVCIGIGSGLTFLTLLVSAALARHRRDVMLSREMLRAAVENISQGLLVVDAQRRVPVLNARAAELLALPPHLASPGIGFDALLEWQVQAGEFEGQEAAPVRDLVDAGGIEHGISVYHRTRRNGTVLEIRTKVLETGLAVRTFTDITEQEQTARVLADARDAAEAAARARSEFLAVMSHEIRTPLNGVIGVAGLLEDMELGPEQRDYVRLIRQSGDHLLVLINDILDFSRLEAARVELESVDFDPTALMQATVDMFMVQANTKGLHLSVVSGDTVPSAVTGDPGRLRQILLNLIGNAVKFTDEGWICVTLSRDTGSQDVAGEPEDDGRVRLLFSVSDSGIGIIPEAIERMFQEFTQMDGSISRRFGGSGLGLSICRRLVELMGGNITVESAPGAGSIFHFDVYLKRANEIQAAEPAINAEPQTGPRLRVLLAEDNPTNRLVALRLLQRLGHDTDAVGNGAEAIDAWALGGYDLILMDVMMPEMDGLTATRHIRVTERSGTRIAIVGLTAGSGTESLSDCLDAGMDAVTTKPVTLARLRASIAEGLRIAGRRPVADCPEATTPRLRELTEMLGDDAVAEIVSTFAADTQIHLTTMREAAECGDTKAIHHSAHSVAGAARNVGVDALAERASALEQTLGSLSATRIMAEIALMQGDLDAALHWMGIGPSSPADQSPIT
jgi:signal transduction histidine kinase/CheY-like chemotaxis protein/HPt (histidine-containing phosphotransfer) domain-containing protein